MGFSILLKAPYIDIDAFYPFEGWDDDDDQDRKELYEKCLAVCPRNLDEIEELVDTITDPENDCLEGIAMAVSGCDASIEVDDEGIENPFSDYEKYEVPELEVLIPEIINSKFCCLKVWENSGEWTYEGEGDFDLSKLSWEKGQFTYDGEEFDSVGGEGSSSYTHFYKDGEEVC